jgi:hypothetical protein
MQIKEKQQLEITVDKRHIIAIGERLYTESVDLLREDAFADIADR